jgi:hypothetical protein
MKTQTLRTRIPIGVSPRHFGLALFRLTSHGWLLDVRLREASPQSSREGQLLDARDLIDIEEVSIGTEICLGFLRRRPIVRVDESVAVQLVNRGSRARELFVEIDVEAFDVVDAIFVDDDVTPTGVRT